VRSEGLTILQVSPVPCKCHKGNAELITQSGANSNVKAERLNEDGGRRAT
jgi:hypothetical protein